MEEAFPNFFVVGAAKCGTTSLYEGLKHHPDVFLSPIKEPHYFATDIDPESFDAEYRRRLPANLDEYLAGPQERELHIAFVRDLTAYRQLFKKVAGERAVGETSTGYLYSASAAREMRAQVPDARIIAILRDPYERTYSHYLMALGAGGTHRPFRQAVLEDQRRRRKGWGVSKLYVELSYYADQLQRYLSAFPPEQVKVVLFDDLKQDAPSLFREIHAHLGVAHVVEAHHSAKHNASVEPRIAALHRAATRLRLKHALAPALRTALKRRADRLMYRAPERLSLDDRRWLDAEFQFDREIARVEEVLGRDLSHWRVAVAP